MLMPAFPARIFRSPPAIVAFAFPVVILAGNKLLTGGVVAVAVAMLVWLRRFGWRSVLPFAVVLGLLALWGALSAAWSIAPGLSLERAARFAGLAICGLFICQGVCARGGADRDAVAAGLLAGLGVAACLSAAGLAWQQFAGKPFPLALNYKPFATVAATLLFPAAGVLCADGARRLAAAGGLVLAALFLWADSLAAAVAVAVGGVVLGVVYFGGRRAAYAVAAAAVAAILVVPALAAWSDAPSQIQDREVRLRQSAMHRIVVWDFVGQRILERPLLGWGLGTARRVPGAAANPLDRPRYRQALLSSGISPDTELRTLPLHPHNAGLHLWLELGAPGLFLYLALCAMCLRQVVRATPDRVALAAGTATVAAVIVIAQVSFSAWQSWWVATQFLAAAILIALYRPET